MNRRVQIPREEGDAWEGAPNVGIAVSHKELRDLLVMILARLRCKTSEVAAVKDLDDLVRCSTDKSRRELHYDALIIDEDFLEQPTLTFLERAQALGEQTYIVFLTAFDLKEHRAQVLNGGAAAVFDKPFDMNQFQRVVKRLLF